MKKHLSIIILSLILLCATFSANFFALADTSEEELNLIFPTIGYHVEFTAPTTIEITSQDYAVYDTDKIIINGIHDTTISYADIPKEMLFIDNYLLVLNNYFEIRIFSIIDGMEHSNLPFPTNANFANSLAYDNINKILYVHNVTNIIKFSIDTTAGFGITYLGEVVLADIYDSSYVVSANNIIYSNGNIYIYKKADNSIFYLNLTTYDVDTFATGTLANAQHIATNDTYLFLSNTEKITRYDIAGHSFVDEFLSISSSRDENITDIGGFAVNGNEIYIANTSYSAIKVFNITGSGASFIKMYGTKGTSLSRLNTPECIDIFNNRAYIADKMNDRIIVYTLEDNAINAITKISNLIIDDSTNTALINPFLVAKDYGLGLYVADDNNKLKHINQGFLTHEYIFDSGILDIAITSSNEVYVALAGQVLNKNATSEDFELFVSKSNITDIAVSENGNIIYVSNDTGITAYASNGTEMPFSIDFETQNINNVADIKIDFIGNIYILTNATNPTLYKYIRNISAYEYEYCIELTTLLDIDISTESIALSDNGEIYFANNKGHLISYIDSDTAKVVIESDTTYTSPDNIVLPSIIGMTSTRAFAYTYPNNYEDIQAITEDTFFIILNTITYQDVEYYYIELVTGDKVYLESSKTTLLTAGDAPYNYASSLHQEVSLYLYPSFYAPIIGAAIPRGVTFEVVDNVAELSNEQAWIWYKVQYGTITGYVLRTEIIPTDIPQVISDTINAIIKAPTLGEKISLYAQPDTNSNELMKLKDATKVIVDGGIDREQEFTLIKYDGVSGYVKTDYLIEKGLTKGQILSIILGSVTFTATIIVFLISRSIRKEYIN